ncbi:MAG: metal-dependent hydrolase [Promethearchaeota archaeon]
MCHIALPLIIFEIPQIKKKYRVNRFALIIGSMLPDFIDKPIEVLGISSGRGYCHTLLFVFTSFMILYLTTRQNKPVSFPFLIGMLIHLLLDTPVPLFYPFIPYDFVEIHEDVIGHWSNKLMVDYLVISTELIGIMIIIFIVINNKLFSVSKILQYLKTNSQITIENLDLLKNTPKSM